MNVSKKDFPRFVLERGDMLKKLHQSKTKCNVVGIVSSVTGDAMTLGVVTDIRPASIQENGDQLVILSMYDLGGTFINTQALLLSEISCVRSFKKQYPHSPPDSSADNVAGEPAVKIRCYEQDVSLQDLRLLFLRILNSGYRIAVNLKWDACLFDEFSYVVGIELKDSYAVAVSPCPDGSNARSIPFDDIGSVDFETSFYFKGLLSKIFRVAEEV